MILLPVIVEGDSRRKLVAGCEEHGYWRKYGCKAQKQYINEQWSVDYKATGIKGNSEYFTASTLGSMALDEDFLCGYFETVSTNNTENRTIRMTACPMFIDLTGAEVISN